MRPFPPSPSTAPGSHTLGTGRKLAAVIELLPGQADACSVNNEQSMKLAFIGGTRFIGHWAVVHVLERAHHVLILHRGQHVNETGAREVLIDRRDSDELRSVLRQFAPDVVIDTCAMTRSDAEGLDGMRQFFDYPQSTDLATINAALCPSSMP